MYCLQHQGRLISQVQKRHYGCRYRYDQGRGLARPVKGGVKITVHRSKMRPLKWPFIIGVYRITVNETSTFVVSFIAPVHST
jgi:hypothetical protein